MLDNAGSVTQEGQKAQKPLIIFDGFFLFESSQVQVVENDGLLFHYGKLYCFGKKKMKFFSRYFALYCIAHHQWNDRYREKGVTETQMRKRKRTIG